MPQLVVDALDGSKIDETYLARVRQEPHASVLHVTVNNLTRIVPNPDLHRAIVDLADYHRRVEHLAEQCFLVDSASAWGRLSVGGRVGIVLGYQNAGWIGADLSLLPLLHGLGVRILQITHNGLNPYGGGCAVAEEEAGLTPLGRDFVQAANDSGILIDCSHSSDRITLDVCAISTQPVLITHANASAVNPHIRNRSDEAIVAVAQTGGIVGITFLPSIAMNAGELTHAGMVGHLQHILKLVGPGAVGFGSDFTDGQDKHGDRYAALRGDGVNVMAHELPYPVAGHLDLEAFFGTLRGAGLDEETIDGFAGRNFARVLERNER